MNADYKLGLQIGLSINSIGKLGMALEKSSLSTDFVRGLRAALNVRLGV